MAQNIGAIIPQRTAAEWAALNPVLVKGQLVHEEDPGDKRNVGGNGRSKR